MRGVVPGMRALGEARSGLPAAFERGPTMKHLWSPLLSQANGISMSVCGVRIDQLPDGDLIKERPPFDCQKCGELTTWQMGGKR
jgi:hypothetical protein